MPIHPDWRKVLNAMIKRYGKVKGTQVFYATMKKRGIDYTKPAPRKNFFHIPMVMWRRSGGIVERITDIYIDMKERKVTDFETLRKRKGMSVSQFYAYPQDPPSKSKFPIFDAAHVRNALARFNQAHLPPEAKAGVLARIKRAAKKFGIKVGDKK